MSQCVCWHVCKQSELASFLRRLPATIDSPSSPWLPYLEAVYGQRPPLPYPLSRLRFLYHGTSRWQRSHPSVVWPMGACHVWQGWLNGSNSPPLKGQGVRRGSVGVGYSGIPSWTDPQLDRLRPHCAAEVCNEWLAPAHLPDSQTGFKNFELYWQPSDPWKSDGLRRAETLGTTWYWPGEFSQVNSVHTDVLESHAWAEVIRWQAWSEGLAGFGVFFSSAPGSGMWLNVGRTEVFRDPKRRPGYDKREALDALQRRWRAQETQPHWEWFNGANYTTNDCRSPPAGKEWLLSIYCDKMLPTAFYAYALGLDSYQTPSTFAEHPDLVMTSRAANLKEDCVCDGCSAWRTLRKCGRWNASELSGCGHLDIRLGWPPLNHWPCDCLHDREVLSCANGPIGSLVYPQKVSA